MGQLDDRVERFWWYCLNAAEQTWSMRKQIFLSHYQRFKTNTKTCRTVATIQLHVYKRTKNVFVVMKISNRNACIYRPNNRGDCLNWLKVRTGQHPYGSGHYAETVVHTDKEGFRKDTEKTGQPSFMSHFPLLWLEFLWLMVFVELEWWKCASGFIRQAQPENLAAFVPTCLSSCTEATILELCSRSRVPL